MPWFRGPSALDNMQPEADETLVKFYARFNRDLSNRQDFTKPQRRLKNRLAFKATKTNLDMQNIELTRELSVILTEMRNQGLDTPPLVKKEGILLGRDAKHWCDYHKSRGHHTDNCFQLCADIEKQIRSGRLL